MNMNVFEPITLAGIRLRNRILRSATHEGLADENGFPTPALRQKYLQLAKGGVGAIITGYAGVHPAGKSPYVRMNMIDQDASIPAWRDLVDAVHSEGAPIILQVAHCGRQTYSALTGYPTLAPSALRDGLFNEDMPKELTPAEIEEIIELFVQAVLRAKAAGFDGVQLHAAHGYLLSEFLSPGMNRRSDAWGGNTENRFRIVAEIYQRLKSRAPGYPVLIKINGHDGRPQGMRIDEAVKIAKLLEQAGCAGIEVSGGVAEEGFFGTSRPESNPVDALFYFNHKIKKIPGWVRFLLKPLLRRSLAPKAPTRMYNLPDARAIKAAVSIPVIVVGGIKSFQDIQNILNEGSADAVSLCRSLILEPNLVEKFRTAKQTEARCLGCDYCILGIEAESLRCYLGKLPKQPSIP